MTIPLAILFSILTIAVGFVVYGTIQKKRFGINFARTNCPHCAALLPMIRRPLTVQQSTWGGWTCKNCGTEIDKWGRKTSLESQTQDGRIQSR